MKKLVIVFLALLLVSCTPQNTVSNSDLERSSSTVSFSPGGGDHGGGAGAWRPTSSQK